MMKLNIQHKVTLKSILKFKRKKKKQASVLPFSAPLEKAFDPNKIYLN